MILIQSPDGSEKCLVTSLDGYDGWTVIANPCRPPNDGEFWCSDNDAWKPIEGAPDPELLAKVRNPVELAKIIESLQAQLTALQ